MRRKRILILMFIERANIDNTNNLQRTIVDEDLGSKISILPFKIKCAVFLK